MLSETSRALPYLRYARLVSEDVAERWTPKVRSFDFRNREVALSVERSLRARARNDR